eukprot:31098-Pyramimonas_sp.AAC.1
MHSSTVSPRSVIPALSSLLQGMRRSHVLKQKQGAAESRLSRDPQALACGKIVGHFLTVKL